MRTYDKMLNNELYHFRLTVGAQKALEKKFGEQANQFVFACADSVEKMTYLLGAAASYQGNENPTTNGDEIYDLLVDDGVAGQEDVGFQLHARISLTSRPATALSTHSESEP